MTQKTDLRRVRVIQEGEVKKEKPIVYWMSRDQRAKDNWTLHYAQEQAMKNDVPLVVVFCLVPSFLGATRRQYDFMLTGLKEVEENLRKKNIEFILLVGNPVEEISKFIKKNDCGLLVKDFSPLKIYDQWCEGVKKAISTPIHEVDAHNIIPVWVVSDKQEYAARTIRPKINRLLSEFLTPYPHIIHQKVKYKGEKSKISWEKAQNVIRVDEFVAPVDWLLPGQKEAKKTLKKFIDKKIDAYDYLRNDPVADGQSNLSPYLHFGQISAQAIALELQKVPDGPGKDAFLEEIIVRRELSDNFCFYNKNYDSTKGFANWAKETLKKHEKDKREYTYTQEECEKAQTHDYLWNAAQKEMVKKGKMHGYMRMYWAKKILEWTKTPQEAMKIAIELNDKYQLDGRDPNGYAGIAWSIGGVHDRPWFERPIFGTVRFMNEKGCERKFDTRGYMWKTK
ncbi:MAG: deoxyribodipyrimidine photo-lyase [Candidatus Moranbacteria bacterium]|nr:deoxyribodipyrimidine photo-lyase [Candidatus Moranbacteria bacterium]